MTEVESAFLAAGEAFVELVDRIPVASFSQPGLGVWDLRGLTGHTCRALRTVYAYLEQPAESVECASAGEYYALMRDRSDHDVVAQRGIETGEQLGADPAVEVQKSLERARSALAGVRGDDPVIVTAAGGMHLHAYLPTRTFELVVHSSDLALAADISYEPPAAALEQTFAVIGELARIHGIGLELVRRLTGREARSEVPSSLI